MLKSFPKIITVAFLIIFIFQLIGLIFIFTLPTVSQAAPAEFTPQVEIPGFKFNSKANDTSNIAELIKAIYIYAIGIVGILAAVVLMIGGVMWIIAGGNATAIGEAKAWIGASLTGLVLALSSYLILATVNPALVDFKPSGIRNVDKIEDENDCRWATTSNFTTYSKNDCKAIAKEKGWKDKNSDNWKYEYHSKCRETKPEQTISSPYILCCCYKQNIP